MDKLSPKIKGQMNRTLGIQQGWRSLAASAPRALQAFSSQQSQDWTPHHASCRMATRTVPRTLRPERGEAVPKHGAPNQYTSSPCALIPRQEPAALDWW